jgi:hypothetical protein
MVARSGPSTSTTRVSRHPFGRLPILRLGAKGAEKPARFFPESSVETLDLFEVEMRADGNCRPEQGEADNEGRPERQLDPKRPVFHASILIT